MKVLNIIGSIIAGLLVITLFVESIELVIVKLSSGLTFTELADPINQEKYFRTRNTAVILSLKMLYSLCGGFIGGYLTSFISPKTWALTSVGILIILQIVSLLWAGFISDSLAQTGPTWIWLCLLCIIPIGIILGHQTRFLVYKNKKKMIN